MTMWNIFQGREPRRGMEVIVMEFDEITIIFA
jgi:hypothetical protein